MKQPNYENGGSEKGSGIGTYMETYLISDAERIKLLKALAVGIKKTVMEMDKSSQESMMTLSMLSSALTFLSTLPTHSKPSSTNGESSALMVTSSF